MSLWFVCSDDGVRASVVSTSGVYRWWFTLSDDCESVSPICRAEEGVMYPQYVSSR